MATRTILILVTECGSVKDLYRVVRSPSREVCCGGGAELVSCQDIALVPGTLGRSLRIHNLTWARGGEVEPGGLVYRTPRGEEAVLTLGRHTGTFTHSYVDKYLIVGVFPGHLFGSFKLHDGRSFGIERCFNGYILKEFDLASFPAETSLYPSRAERRARGQGWGRGRSTDNTSLATLSVMVYYTPQVLTVPAAPHALSHYPQFAAVTADIGGYVDQVLAETNLGYINSGVALRVQRFCLELATINDTQLSLSFLNKFQAMKVGPVLAPRVTCHVSRVPAPGLRGHAAQLC